MPQMGRPIATGEFERFPSFTGYTACSVKPYDCKDFATRLSWSTDVNPYSFRSVDEIDTSL